MLTFKELTHDYLVISSCGFTFKSQDEVVYFSFLHHAKSRLTKSDLIISIEYFIRMIKGLSPSVELKSGFNLRAFKYYELSVYLHGLLQVWHSLIEIPPVGELYIKRFSHLPHDVMKPEKETVTLEVSYLRDFIGETSYYVCVHGASVHCSHTLEGLKEKVTNYFPAWSRKREIVFTVK